MIYYFQAIENDGIFDFPSMRQISEERAAYDIVDSLNQTPFCLKVDDDNLTIYSRDYILLAAMARGLKLGAHLEACLKIEGYIEMLDLDIT